MFFKQYYLGCLSHASYMVGDEESGAAVVIDPQRDVDQYLADAEREGLTIRHVFLTHFHADFISGHLELRDLAGATIHMGRRADTEYECVKAGDGDSLDLGKLRLTVLETPGHTPECICILVFDMAADPDRPYAVLTGDTLFIGDVGRPDLLASFGVTADELAADLYDSLTQKLMTLPDETLVYPAHGAGSMCGKHISKETVSTIGAQKKFNYALQPMSKGEFIKLVACDQPEAPGYFAYDAVLNRQERPVLRANLESAVKPLTLARVLELRKQGAQILDVRDPAEFAGAHMVDSINVGLSGQFAIWCGTVLDRHKPTVIVGDPGQEAEAAMRLGRIGIDSVAGYLDGGMAALAGKEELVRTAGRVTAQELAEMLESPAPPVVLDVRNDREYQSKHIAGSIHIPLNRLAASLDEVPRGKPLVIHCAGGYRSSIAASLLRLHKVADAPDLIGGIGAWEAGKFKVVAPAHA